MAAMMAIITGAGGKTISGAITLLIQQIDDVIRLDENRKLLDDELNRMKSLLLDINHQFEDRQRTAPESLQYCVRTMQNAVERARELINRSERRQRCTDCLFRNPKVSREIREWKGTFAQLFQNLQIDFSVFCSAQQIASAAPQQANLLLQDEPDTGLVGLEIRAAEIQLERWLTEPPHERIFAVYGMGGVGKTALLKKVYNTYKVSDVFDHVIWVAVAQFPILELQSRIASVLNLDLASCSYNDVDTRKMKLSAHLRTKKFFLVLDDMWSAFTLKELGVQFVENRGSKLVFSTRNRDLIPEMNADQSIQIQPLPTEEAWDLFCKVAFEDGHVPEDIEHIARVVADECKGLPLAINVIASSMKGNPAVNEWNLALRQIQTVDSNFPITHPRIDRDLYQRLRWSYDNLPHAHLKSCFLYCIMFPEDMYIPVHIMVHMLIAEGIVKSKDANTLVDTVHSYVKFLADRCLFELKTDDGADDWGLVFGVHDVARDMAIYVGEKEENCVSRAGQHCSDIEAVFPDIEARNSCKRLSLSGSEITSLPAEELRCPKLVSLHLVFNFELHEIPEAFFLNLVSLRVLDLGNTGLQSLPRSLWELKQLEFLGLNYTQIDDVQGMGNFSNLQFLHMRGCVNLKSLPSEIGDLKNLKFLDVSGCINLESLPCEIGQLKNLKHLNLRDCKELNVIRPEITMLLNCQILQ